MGKGMQYVAWILALILLTFLFGDWEESKNNPNRNLVSSNENGRILVELKKNRWNSYITPGTINGVPVSFIIDTGANDVAIPKELQEKLGLIRGQRGISMTANGETTHWKTHIDTLTIGDITLYDIDGSILSNFPSDHILLGMSALSFLELRKKDDTLTLIQ